MAAAFKELISVPIDVSVRAFWNAIEIFLWNSRITSKNVAGVIFDTHPVLEYEGQPLWKDLQAIANATDVNAITSRLAALPQFTREVSLDHLKENLHFPERTPTFIWIVKILYKNIKYRPFSYKCYILNFQNQSATVLPLRLKTDELQSLPYQIQFSESKLIFRIDDSMQSPVEDKTIDWLLNAVVPRFEKWMQQDLASNSDKSLKLVNCEEYNEKYNALKCKYGSQMIAIWPERTDPAKFVYEDVAIATYLLLIWKQERERSGCKELQSFVDLGCGNGLLVYLLTKEGHKGFGIDLRKRGIWDMYPEVDLRVETIIPSDENLYPHTDWIIGNHSDELSPWVPVIAARSSPKCRFFLLPCCAFDFNGQRFQRRDSSVSQYLDFLEYAKEISSVCGYDTLVDRLKIPSTKRICLIGYDRTANARDLHECSQNITQFIQRRTETGKTSSTWSVDFKPRETVEAVRNCTKVNKSVIDEIVDLVFKQILMGTNFDPTIFDGKWNRGDAVPLSALADRLPKQKLSELKSECGGLQTLLKNHHQIFEVKGGAVQIRIPLCLEEKRKQLTEQAKKKSDSGKQFQFQQKPCYFYLNHPQGCPWNAELCTFKHQE